MRRSCRVLLILALCVLILSSAACGGDDTPVEQPQPQSQTTPTTTATETASPSQPAESVCALTMERVGQQVRVIGTIGHIDRNEPTGIYADLEEGACHTGIWINRELWGSLTDAEQSVLETGTRAVVEGLLRSFEGNLVVDVSSPILQANEFIPEPVPEITATATASATVTEVMKPQESPAPIADRTLVVEPIGEGEYAVGSSYFMLSEDARHDSEKANDERYWLGSIENGDDVFYVDDILDSPEIHFEMQVPDDPQIYGSEAGETIPYSGVLFYPTTQDNPYSYQFPDIDESIEFPYISTYMQGKNEAPVFADMTQQYPLVIFSGGAGANPLYEADDLIWLASHGFVVLEIMTGDDRFPAFDHNSFLIQGLMLRLLSTTESIDYLENHPDYRDHINFNRIGGWGASYGATTMFTLMGGKIVDLTSPNFDVLENTPNDPRITAAVGITPGMGSSDMLPATMGTDISFFGLHHAGARNITGPYLAIAGSKDTLTEYEYTEAVLEAAKGDMYLVKCLDEDHVLSTGAYQDAMTWSLIFLKAYIQGDESEREEFEEMISVEGGAEDYFIALGQD